MLNVWLQFQWCFYYKLMLCLNLEEFENQSAFGEIMSNSKVATFLTQSHHSLLFVPAYANN